MKALALALLLTLLHVSSARAQQVADSTFRPPIARPAYPVGKGPLVLIDEAHDNFHTASGRYLPFAELLRRDGYVVKASAQRFSAELLRGARVLVIANARMPASGPALSVAEVAAVRQWVTDGGALLLIVDHPPNVVAAQELARTFGVRLRDAGAINAERRDGRIVFRRSDGTLADHAVTSGITEVVTFTGSSFELERAGTPLLVFGPNVFASRSEDDPDPAPLQGHLQGALLTIGSGRVAVFAEAAMFSAQVTGPQRSPMGMNAAMASQNVQFLLNLLYWLSRP